MSFPDDRPGIYVPGPPPPQEPLTLQQVMQPAGTAATPPRSTRGPIVVAAVLAALVAALVVTLVFVVTGEKSATPAARSGTPAGAAPAAAKTTPAAAGTTDSGHTPTAADFTLTVKILEKKCFGSAGCNVTFRIELAYGGPPLNPSKTYEITYRIDGTDEEAYINTLEVTGTQYRTDESEIVSTKSSKSVLAAVITGVSPA